MPSGVGLGTSTHPVRACVTELASVLDQVPVASKRVPLSAAEVAGVVADLDRVINRAKALKLSVLASGEAEQVAEQGGFTSTGAWLAQQTRASGGDAARQVRLAGRLKTAGRTQEALAAGEISADHAEVLTGALDQMPDRLSPAERAKVESRLVDKARKLDPHRLRKAARRALEAVEPDPAVVDAHEDQLLESEEQRAWDKARCTLHDNGDGTTSLHAVVPTLAADIVRKILDTLTAPRRQRHEGHDTGVTAWAHERGLAFAHLLERLPTDHLHSKTAATVVVHLRHDALLGALAAAGIDTDHPISAAAARRLACGAGLIPAVFGDRSLPLDLGRQQRLFDHRHKIALSATHTACAAEGCTIPIGWCELHHRDPWSRGGKTDLGNAVPLCGHHHRLAHATDPTTRTGPDRSGRARPRVKVKPVRIPQQRRAPART